MYKKLSAAEKLLHEKGLYKWEIPYCLVNAKQIDFEIAVKDYKNNKCYRNKKNSEIVKCFKDSGFKIKRVREFTYIDGRTVQSVTYDIVKMEVA